MNSISLNALCNGKSSTNCVSVVEARSACQVVQEENQGQERTTRAVQFAGPLDIHVLKNISSADNFIDGKVRKDGMGHPGLLFQVSNDGSASETRNSSLGNNLENTKYVDNKCADKNKSTSDEKLTLSSNGSEINDDAYSKVKNENVSSNSWFRTWPERGPDKFICYSGKSSKNSTSDCRLNGVPDEQKQEWHGRITQDNGAEISEKNCKSNFANSRKSNNSRARSAEFSTQHSLSPSADGCAPTENVDASLASSNYKCISTPISLTKLLESMPSLAYNPVTKGLQLAVTEREGKGDPENDIPICKPAIPDDEEDDLCERVAPPWAQHHPGCMRNGRLEIIEEEDEEERRKGNRQRTIEDPPDLFPSLPARPLPSTSSSSASLSSVSSLSTGTGGCTTDEGCHGEGPFGGSIHHSSSKGGENRRSGITGFFSRNIFAWKLSKDGYQGSNGLCEGSAPGWKLFGKVPPRQVPAARDPAVIAEEFNQAKSESSQKLANGYHKNKFSNMQKLENAISNGYVLPNGLDWGAKNLTITNSTTALILENRPANLPAKSPEEEERHRQEYQMMLEAARKKELKEAKRKKKQLQQQLKMEEQLANAARTWSSEILPKWETMKGSRKTRELWWQGIPPSVRGKVWRLSISNDLNITPELYEICVSRAQERLKAAENGNVCCNGGDSESASLNLDGVANGELDEDNDNPNKESSVELIQLDISRTFPHLCIFQEGGPYYDILHSLIGAYVCYRPDVGYVQGMSFLAAVLILNMDAPDAFICFANLLNRPCHIAFFRLKEPVMEAYYATYKEFFRENLPRLCQHFEQQGLSPDLYLLEWLYTVFAKAMPLDIACRVWDVFLRDGEEFLFRTALGVLHLNQELLLSLDFIRGAQFLTRLPDDLSADSLFRSIEAIRMNVGKLKFSEVLAQHLEQSKRGQPSNSRSVMQQTPS